MSVGDTDFSPPTTAVNFPIAIHLATYRGWRILAIIVELLSLRMQLKECLSEASGEGWSRLSDTTLMLLSGRQRQRILQRDSTRTLLSTQQMRLVKHLLQQDHSYNILQQNYIG